MIISVALLRLVVPAEWLVPAHGGQRVAGDGRGRRGGVAAAATLRNARRWADQTDAGRAGGRRAGGRGVRRPVPSCFAMSALWRRCSAPSPRRCCVSWCSRRRCDFLHPRCSPRCGRCGAVHRRPRWAHREGRAAADRQYRRHRASRGASPRGWSSAVTRSGCSAPRPRPRPRVSKSLALMSGR